MAPFRNTDFSKDILLKRYAAAKLPAPLAPGTQGGDIQPTTAPGTELMPIQKPVTQLNPMASRYAKNPYPGQERAMEKILDHSGYAKPLVAFMMARAGKKGAEFANNQATALAEAEQKKAALENEYKMIDYMFKVAEKNPQMANKIAEAESQREGAHPIFSMAKTNPFAAQTQNGISFHQSENGLLAVDNAAVLKAITEGKPLDGTYKLIPGTEKKNDQGAKTIDDFRQHVGNLDSLYKAKASIQKGIDPLTGAAIGQENIEKAQATIDAQIGKLEGYVASTFPDQWKKYNAVPTMPKEGFVNTPGGTIPNTSMPKRQFQNKQTGEVWEVYADGTQVKVQ